MFFLFFVVFARVLYVHCVRSIDIGHELDEINEQKMKFVKNELGCFVLFYLAT